VKACVDCGTDYLDFSSDESVIEHLERNYHDSAKEQEIFVVPACGYCVRTSVDSLTLV